MHGPQPNPTSRPTATPDDRRVIVAMIRPILVAAVVTLAAAGLAGAQYAAPPGPATPVAWQSLLPAQQRLLQKFAGSWDALPAGRQQALARGSTRWLSMTPLQRQRAQRRFARWRALTPAQRDLLRRRWQRFKSLPPEQQRQIRADYRRFRHLPPAGRRALRRKWRMMTPQQRRSALGRRRWR